MLAGDLLIHNIILEVRKIQILNYTNPALLCCLYFLFIYFILLNSEIGR